MYEYRVAADSCRVIDGDTVELTLDLGCNVFIREICRLYGIDAAEIRDNAVMAAQASRHLNKLLANEPITCRTHKDRTGKFGRYLVELTDFYGRSINQAMIEDGYAKPYK